jgi:WD40 repeat protein
VSVLACYQVARVTVLGTEKMDFSRHTARDVVGYSKMVHDLKWNKEGNYLGMVSADKTVKVGQLDKTGSFQNVHSIPNSASMMQVCWNPQDDSRIGMCGDDKSVELWDVRGN